MVEHVTYPVLLTKEDGWIIIKIPDFQDCITQAETEEEAIDNAGELIASNSIDLESAGKRLPKPSTYSQFALKEGEKLIYVQVWLPYYRKIKKEIYVKKTLTIPQYLNELAKDKDINFSAILVKGIKEELGIYDG